MRKRDLRGNLPVPAWLAGEYCSTTYHPMSITSRAEHHAFDAIEKSHVKPRQARDKPGRPTSSPDSSSSSRSASLPSRAQFVSITAGPSSITNLFTTDQEHRSFTFFCEYPILSYRVRLAMSSEIGLCFKQYIMSPLFDMLLLRLVPCRRDSHNTTPHHPRILRGKKMTISL